MLQRRLTTLECAVQHARVSSSACPTLQTHSSRHSSSITAPSSQPLETGASKVFSKSSHFSSLAVVMPTPLLHSYLKSAPPVQQPHKCCNSPTCPKPRPTN